MKFCPKCGTSLADEDRFCRSCGTDIMSDAEQYSDAGSGVGGQDHKRH